MLPIFIGVDKRQPVSYTVLRMSIEARASVPVSITPLLIDTLPIERRGLTDFTFARYLVPHLMGYKGVGLFLDADMLVDADIKELFDLHDPKYAVQVVKGPMRFEWPSLMLFNSAKCKKLTPQFIEYGRPQDMEWGTVGELPAEWNHCIGYDEPRPDAKLYHYTMGIPAFPETQILGAVDIWRDELKAACSTVPWADLMSGSVHAKRLQEIHQMANQ